MEIEWVMFALKYEKTSVGSTNIYGIFNHFTPPRVPYQTMPFITLINLRYLPTEVNHKGNVIVEIHHEDGERIGGENIPYTTASLGKWETYTHLIKWTLQNGLPFTKSGEYRFAFHIAQEVKYRKSLVITEPTEYDKV